MASSLHDCAHGQLKIAQRLIIATQILKYADKVEIIDRYGVKRIAQEKKWEDGIAALGDMLLRDAGVARAYEYAASVQARKWRVRKQTIEEDEIRARLVSGIDYGAWEHGAVQVYLGLALETSETAGQFALELLGLNTTFAWAHPRAMASDLFAMRGSKIVQNLYGAHLNALARIIQDATNPAHPLTIQQVKLKIAEEWPQLEGWQALRIARTETAAVWSSTTANAYRANGVEMAESLVAHGPVVDVANSEPCNVCIDLSAGSPYPLGSMMLPPYHPNCRCEIVPVLEGEDGTPWLPPAEPWAGAADDLLEAVDDLEG